jgi:hypothetical protein
MRVAAELAARLAGRQLGAAVLVYPAPQPPMSQEQMAALLVNPLLALTTPILAAVAVVVVAVLLQLLLLAVTLSLAVRRVAAVVTRLVAQPITMARQAAAHI